MTGLRITGVALSDVDGFGVLHDTAVEGIAPGLTIVTGPNGAGKSSLHALIVRVLFGLPRSNAAGVVRHFEPLRGGRHKGGAVTALDGDGGVWRVTRRQGGTPALLVDGPDGRSWTDQEALRPLLGDLDRERFEQLFAIDLSRLVGMEDLDADQLQSMLYRAATLGTSGSLRGARRLARERADALYLPRGRKQPVADAAARRRDAANALAAAQAEAASLRGLVEETERLRLRREERRARQRELLDVRAELDAAVSAWPQAQEAVSLGAELAELDGPAVPDDVRARLAERRAQLRTAGEAQQTHRRAAAAAREEAARRVLDDRLAAVAPEVAELAGQLQLHRDRVQRLADARGAHERAVAHRDELVTAIAPGVAVEQLLDVRVDAAARDLLARTGGEVEAAERAHQEGTRAHEEATEALSLVDRRVQSLREQLVEVADHDRLTRRADALAVLEAGLSRVEQSELAAAERERALQAARAHVAQVELGGGPPPWLSWLLLGIGLVVVAVGVVVDVAAVAALGAVLLAAGVALVSRVVFSRGRAASAPVPAPPPPPPADDAISALARQVEEAAAELGLPARPAVAELAAARRELDDDRAAAATDDEVRARLRELTEERARAAAVTEARAADAAHAAARLDRAMQAWEEARSALGLAGLAWIAPDPGATRAAYERIREVVAAHGSVGATSRAVEALANEVAGVEHRACELQRAADGTVMDGPAAVAAIPALAERCAVDASDREAVTRLEREAEQADERATAAAAAAGEHEAAIAQELSGLGLPDLDAFDRAVATDDRRRELETALDALDAQVAMAVGTGDTPARRRLAQADPAAWAAERAQLDAELATAEAGIDELTGELTRAEDRIDEIGGADTVARRSFELEAATDELEELVRRWAVFEVAHRILDTVVDGFESRQQPVVLRNASTMLGRITHGRWQHVRMLEGAVYAREHPTSELVAAEQLSTGEQAQLYLSLRLALAEHRGPGMPLLLDDLLTTSDDDRADTIAAALGAVADQRQVLLFTASARTVEAVRSQVPGSGTLRLDAGRMAYEPPAA